MVVINNNNFITKAIKEEPNEKHYYMKRFTFYKKKYEELMDKYEDLREKFEKEKNDKR